MSSILDRCAELEEEHLERLVRDAQIRGGEGHSDTELAGSALAAGGCFLVLVLVLLVGLIAGGVC